MAQTTEQPQTRTDLIESKIDREAAGQIALTDMGLRFASMVEIMEFAKMMAVSGPAVRSVFRNNPGACLAVTMKANFFGFEPFSFASKCYFVNEELAYESQLIHAIILAKGGMTRRPTFTFDGEGDKRKCTVTLFLPEPDGAQIYVSPEFGKILPKNSPLWKTDPDQQHIYYSLRAAARRHIPDVILGMYDLEEMGIAQARDVNARPASQMNVSEKLKSGPALEVVYTSGKKAPEPTGNDPQAAEQAPAAQTTTETSEAPSATAEPADGASGEDLDPDVTDMFEKGALMELRTALGKADTPAKMAVLKDEFGATIGMASEVGAARMRELIAAKDGELGA